MSLKDGVYYSELYGEYSALLTENQRSVFEMYFSLDLSLGEIAEIKSVSRQSVQDSISKVKKALETFEEKLGLVQKKKAIYELIDAQNDKKVQEIAPQIKQILGED